MSDALATLEASDGVARITLNHPQRRNSLTPALLEALNGRLDVIDPEGLTAIVIAGGGESFSSGGDVAEFAAREGDALTDYADRTVSLLNSAILKLLAAPVPVIARLQGFVTGGAAGFVFAADTVAMADDAYIAPYYSVVGFAPDGGWTAILPDLIGSARACEIQFSNRKISADEAKALGIAMHVVPAARLDDKIDEIVADLHRKSSASLARTKRLIWSEQRLQRVKAGLEMERRTFVEQITTRDARERMAAFLRR
ncbi:MAG: enoyl-CoA hydratase/isomerase family protein [Pseudomonadota bacterium]